MTQVQEPSIDPLIGAPPGRELAMSGGYDAGDRTSRELAMWHAPMQSADMDILPDKMVMDSRVRDTLRNDAYVHNGATIQKDSIVGELFMLNAKPNWKCSTLPKPLGNAQIKLTLLASS